MGFKYRRVLLRARGMGSMLIPPYWWGGKVFRYVQMVLGEILCDFRRQVLKGKRPYVQSALGPWRGRWWQASRVKPLRAGALGPAGQPQTQDKEPKPTVCTWISVGVEGLASGFLQTWDCPSVDTRAIQWRYHCSQMYSAFNFEAFWKLKYDIPHESLSAQLSDLSQSECSCVATMQVKKQSIWAFQMPSACHCLSLLAVTNPSPQR